MLPSLKEAIAEDAVIRGQDSILHTLDTEEKGLGCHVLDHGHVVLNAIGSVKRSKG